MIIQAKPIPFKIFKIVINFLAWIFKTRFNKVFIKKIAINKNHSYLLMCNHFSFWDGFWACYLSINSINKSQEIKGIYMMILEKQLKKNMFLRYLGCFSVAPGKASVKESLNFAAKVLNTAGNILLMYPQGNLESQFVRNIVVKEGIFEIITRIKGNCQLIWSSNFLEYFESFKPSLYFYMMDCGNASQFNTDKFTIDINEHHQLSMKKQYRFTNEKTTTK